ncbi:non-homologous end-joining DNA ligase [Aquihabitans sp. G128]|uniref:non-homologous end-joining DNA ligase n=1 Tax=Aquihabitans sp. G128 TaxID=2849779 RepID=UPI001C22E12F|nr:non-homologous end-joining DNA ligase [Aquihabitans sp. G128]QXC59511.1 non-homologous end-joining DNA ligase [Aquihabitans sp. G128]
MASEAITVEASGREVRITSPDKVFFKTRGETKLDLVRYYQAVEGPLLATIAGRPTMLQRFPDGAHGKSFFQKRVPAGAPDWLQTTEVSTPNGTSSNALVVADLAHLLWAVNQGCLGFHPWPYRAATPEVTDELRIDLDPGPGVTFDMVREAAVAVRDLFTGEGITSYVKTTGNRGLHIYVRVGGTHDSYAVRAAAVAVARELERRHPDLLTAAWWKEERGERVFIDYNQNAPHKTVFGAWCVRPRVGGQVSLPIPWDEVATVDPEVLTLDVVPAKVAAEGDPWAAMDGEPQDLAPLLAWSERDLADGLMDAPWPPVYPKQPNEPPRVAPSRAKADPDAAGPDADAGDA